MRGVHPADKAHRLIDEAEFELNSIKELMAQCKALDRTGAPKPPPLPLMPLSPPVAAARHAGGPCRAPRDARRQAGDCRSFLKSLRVIGYKRGHGPTAHSDRTADYGPGSLRAPGLKPLISSDHV